MEFIDPIERVLLTGAGFTHNFGAPLAAGIWAEIFNSGAIKSFKNVKDFLRKKFDFESVYEEVLTGSFSDSEKNALKQAVWEAFEKIDKNLCGLKDETFPANAHGVDRLIDAFCGQEKLQGYIFTLNQDIFLERFHCQGRRPIMPGIRGPKDKLPPWFQIKSYDPNINGRISEIPVSDEENKDRIIADLKIHQFFYIKLHGSYGWRRMDGTDNLVIGHRKEREIKKDPLLRHYFEIFEEVLNRQNRRLFIIGYGFRDEHINSILAHAIKNSGLKLAIVSPQAPPAFRLHLHETTPSYSDVIWKGTEAYICKDLCSLFPKDDHRQSMHSRCIADLMKFLDD